MAVTIQTGQTGTLTFMPNMAGIDAARVTDVKWTPQGGATAVEFAPPDQVTGKAPGTRDFQVMVRLTPVESGPEDKLSYSFTVQAIEPAMAGPPLMPPPVAISVNLAPPPPIPPAP